MEDKLKKYIAENRSSFDSFEPPDVWTAISAGMSSAPIINPKILKAMFKYGFGASAIIVTTFVVVQKFAVKTENSLQRPVPIAVQSRTVLDSSPSVISMLPIQSTIKKEPTKNSENLSIDENDSIITPLENSHETEPSSPSSTVPAYEVINTQANILKDSSFVNVASPQVDTSFKGVKRIEVISQYCQVNVKSHNSDLVKFKGEMKDGGGDVLVLGSISYKNKDHMIRYKQQGQLLRVWIEEKDLGKRVRTTENGKIDSYLNFEVPKETEVTVENGSGDITVGGLKAGKISLTAKYGQLKVSDIAADLDLTSSSGNIIVKRIQGNIKSKSSYGQQHFDSISGNVYLRSSSGNIEITELTGDADVASSYGKQKYSLIQGNLTAVASSGDIIIKHLKGNVITTTTYGTQDFEDIQGNLTGTGSSGSIKVDGVTGKLFLGTSYGNIIGKNVKLIGSSEFKASSGNITMQLMNDSKDLRFDLVTSSGKLSVKRDRQDITADDKLTAGEGKIEIRGSTTYGNQQYR